jgi:hypothetical protein
MVGKRERRRRREGVGRLDKGQWSFKMHAK